jgi:LAO/AO transport system kinase
VGKSTFIEAFGQYLIDQGHKVAVLAIDPSSQSSGGSILGDKTRMEHLSTKENVFIRPTAAGSALGGVARKTRETIYLCETAGYDVILIETVGVGQSETLVHSMVDFFLLLMLSGAGDELQGIKRGIMEMADALVVTKADGSNKKSALAASKAYGNAMHLFPAKSSGWISKSFTCSALENENIDQVWQTIEQYQNQTIQNGWFKFNREQQDIYWLTASLKEYILSDFFENECWLSELKKTEKLVADQKLTVFNAAEQLFKSYQNSRKNDA